LSSYDRLHLLPLSGWNRSRSHIHFVDRLYYFDCSIWLAVAGSILAHKINVHIIRYHRRRRTSLQLLPPNALFAFWFHFILHCSPPLLIYAFDRFVRFVHAATYR
jgi:hypothetical protein